MEDMFESVVLETNGTSSIPVRTPIEEITQVINNIPFLFKFDLAMVSMSVISINMEHFFQHQNQQINSESEETNTSQQQNDLAKQFIFKEKAFLDQFQVVKAEKNLLKSSDSGAEKIKEQLTTQNQNQKIGIQSVLNSQNEQKNSKGIYSNQIVNPRLSQMIVTKSDQQQISDSHNSQQQVEKQNPQEDWHKYFQERQKTYFSSKELEKKSNKQFFPSHGVRSTSPDITQQYSNIHEQFQSLITQQAKMEKTQTSSSFINNNDSHINKEKVEKKGSSPKFRLIVKPQKKTNNQFSEHIQVTLPQGQKKFQSFEQKRQQNSKSLDKVPLKEYFKQLSTSQEYRDLASKPFDYTVYSQISKIVTPRSSQNVSQMYYRKKKQNEQSDMENHYRSGNSCSDQNLQFYDNDSFDNESQTKICVDLSQFQQQKQQSLYNSNSHNNLQRDQFSFKPQPQTFEQSTQQNYQLAQTFSPQGPTQKEQINTTNSQGQKDSLQSLRTEQPYFQPSQFSNYLYSQSNTLESQGKNGKQQTLAQNNQKSKKPIEIKLNIQQFMSTGNEQIKNQKSTTKQPFGNSKKSNHPQ